LSKIRFYLDENVNPAIAEQLARGGIDAITVRDLDELGDHDINHLQRAADLERVLCTHDTDFLKLAAQNTEHAGIVFVPHRTSIGTIVNGLRELHAQVEAEDIKGQVRFL
jgi:predicted nuclease of predicted toxin-antitoxin system